MTSPVGDPLRGTGLVVAGTVVGAAEQRVALAVVSGEAGCARELIVGFSVATDAME